MRSLVISGKGMATIVRIRRLPYRLNRQQTTAHFQRIGPVRSGIRCAAGRTVKQAMTTPYKLDRIDQKIIEILKADGRISFQRLAEQVHLTPRPCQERVRKLERAGIIRGYSALVEEEAEPGGLTLQLQVALASQSGRAAQEAFEAEMRKRADVLDCWLVSGTFDYMVRLRCADMDGYRTISNSWLANEAFKIERIVSSPEMQTVKSRLAG
jgi:Lrp/AsnC family leucine-responsive transcriptional regulator